ncbi:MAG: UbiA family prenyltransferase [Candidatus Thermoplasmatota archaeon]
MRIIKAYAQVWRLEYLPAVIFLFLVPLLLSKAQLFTLKTIEASIIFFLLYFVGFAINSLADWRLDREYKTYKSKIAKAISLIGEKKISIIIFFQLLFALLLTLHIVMLTNSYYILFIVGAGIFFGIGYSLAPLSFKIRGIWHGIALSLSAFFIPIFFLYYTLTSVVSFEILILFIGITIAQYSLEISNQTIDYVEDKEKKVTTPPVLYGLKHTLYFSIFALFFGILLISVSFFYLTKASPQILILIFLCIILGYVFPLLKTREICNYLSSKTPETAVYSFRKKIKHSKLQVSGILGIFLVCLIISFPTSQKSLTLENEEIGLYLLGAEFKNDGAFSINVSVMNGMGRTEAKSIALKAEAWWSNKIIASELIFLEKDLASGEIWHALIPMKIYDFEETSFRVLLYNTEKASESSHSSDSSLFHRNPSHTLYYDEKMDEIDSLSFPSIREFYLTKITVKNELSINEKVCLEIEIFNERGIKDPALISVFVYAKEKFGAIDDVITAKLQSELKPTDKTTVQVFIEQKHAFEILLLYNNVIYDKETVRA